MKPGFNSMGVPTPPLTPVSVQGARASVQRSVASLNPSPSPSGIQQVRLVETWIKEVPIQLQNVAAYTLYNGNLDPAQILPYAVTSDGSAYDISYYIFPTDSILLGFKWTATLVNPNWTSGLAGSNAGIFFGIVYPDITTIDTRSSTNIFDGMISSTTGSISRTSGMGFGDRTGLLIPGTNGFGAYYSAPDLAGVFINFQMSIQYVPVVVARAANILLDQ